MKDLGEKALTLLMGTAFVCLMLIFTGGCLLVLRTMWRAW